MHEIKLNIASGKIKVCISGFHIYLFDIYMELKPEILHK